MPELLILRNRKNVPGVGRKIADELGIREVTAGYRPLKKIQPEAVVFNYGVSRTPVWLYDLMLGGGFFINQPARVEHSVDKRKQLADMSALGVPCISWTTNKEGVDGWLADGYSVFARTQVRGKQGKGIIIVNPGEEIPIAPLYTREFKKTHEFRVHVFGGKVIDYVQKKAMGNLKLAKYGLDAPNRKMRNHKQGWTFARNNIFHFPELEEMAINAVAAAGLDYGAVDILATLTKDEPRQLKRAVVCEVNSAPGMRDKNTFRAYINAIKDTVGIQ